MDKFFVAYNLPRLNHKDLENTNRPTASREIVSHQNLSQQHKYRPRQVSSIKLSKKSYHLYFPSSSKILKMGEYFFSPSMDQHHCDTNLERENYIRKLQTNVTDEHRYEVIEQNPTNLALAVHYKVVHCD